MIKKIKRSLALRIFWITFMLLLGVSGVMYGFIAWALPVTYVSRLDSTLAQYAQEFVERLEESTLETCDGLFRQFRSEYGASAALLHPDGTYTFPGLDFGANPGDALQSPEDQDGYSLWIPGEATEKQYPFTFANGDGQYILLVSGETESVNQVTDVLSKILPWLIFLITGISLLVAGGYSRYLAQPIVGLSRAARKMAAMDFTGRCEENRSDEIGMLGSDLNGLSDKLSAALVQLQNANRKLEAEMRRDREQELRRLEFFAAVSHELKTPITIVKGQLEGMLQRVGVYQDREKYMARSLTVIQSMENMVGDLLRISRLESTAFTADKNTFDFNELVREQLARYMELIEQKQFFWQAHLDGRLELNADRKLMTQVISNLLSNAIQYSPPQASLYLQTSLRDDMLTFAIENTNVRIPTEEIPRLFDAFYRLESSRNRKTGGSGLGLFIVSRILRLYDAEYRMENSETGVRFIFTMPREN